MGFIERRIEVICRIRGLGRTLEDIIKEENTLFTVNEIKRFNRLAGELKRI